ncbi:SH3 domain-containing protein [Phenylobacterium sp.]|uniref:SH3 domain-containing protein n=1 Tax=Phenylobacterium sp. TaxID=1871053 RepID=UPI0037C53F07
MVRSAKIAILLASVLSLPAAPVAARGLESLYSCDAEGSANTKAAVVGGLVGALAGSQISKDNRVLGAAIGAGLGAVIGNSIGCRMDRKAQQDAQQAFQRALDTGRTQTWSDPQSGASGRIEVLERVNSAPQTSAASGRWRFAEGVTPVSRVSSQSGTYSVSSRVNVRAAPRADAPVLDRLRVGETFVSSGTVAGGWLAVEEDGLIQGYVARSVVQASDGQTSGDCRRVEQTINERGQPTVREQFNACRDAGGSWNLTSL